MTSSLHIQVQQSVFKSNNIQIHFFFMKIANTSKYGWVYYYIYYYIGVFFSYMYTTISIFVCIDKCFWERVIYEYKVMDVRVL